jgi:hypothetical protein
MIKVVLNIQEMNDLDAPYRCLDTPTGVLVTYRDVDFNMFVLRRYETVCKMIWNNETVPSYQYVKVIHDKLWNEFYNLKKGLSA